MTTESRCCEIMDAYSDALDGRDPNTVEIETLLPSIFKAIPDVEIDEIVAALRWAAQRDKQEADSLERYSNAKFGNAGKTAQPGDGTIPFTKRK